MVNRLNIRDARPGDAPFLAKCILSSMHLYDFETYPSDDMAGILSRLTASETLEDTLYTFRNTRVAELNGTPAGALLSYPGEEYLVRRERTFREFWPEYFSEHADDDPETDPGEWYLDSLAVIPEYRRMGIGKALLQDGIRKGLSQGFNRVALVADPEYPHLVRLYKSLGFAPDGTRHAFGTDFLRMVRRDDGQILSDSLLRYDLGEGVEAFSPERDAVLPYPVTQGHQVHGSRIAVVDRPGMTREELEGYDALMTSLPGG